MSYKHGIIAEKFFSEILYSNGISFKFVDKWYDYMIEDRIKCELKSCTMTILNGNKTGYKIGRFDFTDEDNRQKLIDNNVWIALVVRHHYQCILIGFVPGEKLNGNRYISLHEAKTLHPIPFTTWCQINRLKQERRKCHLCGHDYVLE